MCLYVQLPYHVRRLDFSSKEQKEVTLRPTSLICLLHDISCVSARWKPTLFSMTVLYHELALCRNGFSRSIPMAGTPSHV